MRPEVDIDHHPASGDTRQAPGGAPEAPGGMSGPPGLLSRVIRDQRVLFLIVGGVNTVVGMLWFALFDGLLGHRWNGFGVYPALVLSYVFAILCAFVLYRTVVFRVRGHVLRDLMRFSLVYVVAFLINVALIALFVTALGWPALASQGLIVLVTTLLSWFGHRRFSFRRAGESDEPARGPAQRLVS